MKKFLILTGLILAALHQDFWFWDRPDLVLGILPVGLAYHAAYTIVVAGFWAFVVFFAWPHDLERFSSGGDETVRKGITHK